MCWVFPGKAFAGKRRLHSVVLLTSPIPLTGIKGQSQRLAQLEAVWGQNAQRIDEANHQWVKGRVIGLVPCPDHLCSGRGSRWARPHLLGLRGHNAA